MEKLRKHIENISPIDADEFESIKTHFTTRRVRKGQYLIKMIQSTNTLCYGVFIRRFI